MVRQTRLVLATALLLALAATLAMALRTQYQASHPTPHGESLWRLEYDLRFHVAAPGAYLRVALPDNTAHARVLRESFSHEDLRVDFLQGKETMGREAVAVAPRASPRARLQAQFDIHLSDAPRWPETRSLSALLPAARLRYLQSEPGIPAAAPAVTKALAEIARNGTDPTRLPEVIADFCSSNVRCGGHLDPGDPETVLQRGVASPRGLVRTMIALFRAARIPARAVIGFVLAEEGATEPALWLEAFLDGRWQPYDPRNGFRGALPAEYLPVRRDSVQLVRTPKMARGNYAFAVRRLPPHAGAPVVRGPASLLVLTRLPAGMQQTLALLLLLPVAAVITAVFRNLIGVETFGTFTPSLIAMSFVYADWRIGGVVFLVVLGVGLGGRALLNQFKLLTVPRLGVTLVLAVVCMVTAVSLLDYFGLTPSARAVLLPMVVLTMMIERYHITVEEDGQRRALRVLVGTLFVAGCCFAVIRWEPMGRFLLTFPEAELFCAAALLLIGRYAGYRLAELWRFRNFRGEAMP